MARPGSTTAKVAPKARSLISLILGPVLALGAALVVPIAATPAQAAAGDFECGNNYLYGTYYAAAGSTTTLYKIDASTGATATTVGTFPANVSVNALAISRDGDAAYAISTPASGAGGATLYKFGTGGVKTLSGLTANVGIPAGGYNPFLNDYWFATVDNNTTGKVSLYRVDLDSAATTVAFSTPTLTYTDTNLVGASVGTDLTFDGQGRLYLVLSTNTTTFTNKVITFSPSQLAAGGAQTGTKLVDLDAGNATTTFPGVAFGSAGYLYTEGGTTLYESNPTNGVQVSTHTTALAFSDLGSCANPTIVSAVRKNVVSRAKSGDQFTLSLSGTGFDTPLTATAATPATGIQNEQVASAVILPKTTYAIGETAAGGTNLNDYISTWQCVNDDTDAVVGSGTGPNGSFTAPDTRATGKGVPIVCTITNEAKNAAIKLTKTASGSPTKADQKISYSFTVKNTGNRDLTAVTLTDNLLTNVSCPQATLAAGASMTCTADDYTVKQADVEAGKVVNTASVAATPPSGEGSAGSITSTDKATVNITQTPQLKIVKTLLTGNPFKAGDQLTYGFTVTNTGNVQATGVSVSDSLLSGESCTPTTLAPGASAACTASPYTVTPADVSAGKVVNTATPTGTTVAGAATTDQSSTTQVTTPIGTVPVATPNTTSTKQNIPVSLNPLTDQTPDSPGVSGIGTIGSLDPTSVKLTGTGAAADGKSLTNSDGTYVVDPTTGVVTFTPALNFTGPAASIGYQVTDSFGLVASSTIAITVNPIVPTATNDAYSTPYLTPRTVDVLGNDNAGDGSVPLVPGSVTLKQPGGSYASTLTVAGQGTYTVNATTGEITFTPVAGFAGVATAVTYEVADSNGTIATAKLTMTVANPPAPSATDDTGSALQGHAVTVVPLANDSAGGNATLQPTSVTITTAGTTGGLGKELVVPGKGTWTVAVDGTVTFTPLPAFTGVVSLDYRVADELGQTATAKITVTIDPLKPTAVADTAHAPYGTASLTKDVAGNDIPGDAVAAPIVPSSVVLKQSDGSWATSLTVATEGTYLVNAGGDVTFTPVAGFRGTATPVTYRVADSNGTTATSTLTMTIGNPPVATDDSATTPQNVPVTFAVAGDDTAGDDGAGVPGTIVASSVVFTDPLATDGGRTLVLPGKGTFTINVTTGDVTFTPLASYTGTTPQVDYRVTDSFGNTATAKLKVTITPVIPTADNDTDHAAYGTPSVTTDVLLNDVAGAPSSLVPASVVFTNGTKSLTNADGTYSIDPTTGAVTFTPVAGFSGDAAPVTYRVSDTNATIASATLTVTIGKPPVASPDVDSTPQNVTVTVGVLANDKAGYDGSVAGGLGIQGTLTASSVTFTSPAASPDGRSLTTSEGVWTINATTGEVTFDPNPSYTGTTAAVDYAVTDSYGNTTASTVKITVAAINPTAADDTNHTAYRTPVKTDVVATDKAGAVSAPLDRSSMKITTPGPGLSADGKTLVVAGQGTWTVDGNGDITFAPVAGFSGPASIAYQVSDANGTTVTANLTVTVGVPPSADDEAGTTKQNENITLDLLSGDLPGDDGASTSGTWDASLLVFASNGATSLTVPGQGTYTISQATGKVTFDPIATFTGKADTVAYKVTDSFGNTATANIDITVDPVTPVATDDAATTAYRTPKTIDVVGNDKPGAASAPLDGTTVKITTAGADPDGKGLTTTDGTWTVDPVTGSITFAPAAGYTGDAVITYQVADANGTLTSATVTVTVPSPAAPTVLPDTNHTPYLTPVTTSVLGNDAAGGLAKLQKGSVVFSNGLTSLTNADGIYTVNGTTGDITFAPAPGFSGPATPVTYRVSDELGQTGSATLTVTVGTAPKATDDQTTTPQGVAVTIPELGDDTAGTDGAGVTGTLTKTSVVFTSASATLGGKKLVVANEGTWTIDATTGDATFTPLPTFTGPTTAVDYQVTDSFGNTAAAQLKVVVDGLTPSAGNDTNHGEFGATVTTNVLGNDHGAAPSAPLDPTSVTIVGAPGTGRTLAVPGQGTWTVNATTGAITFTPAAGFHGTPDPITYQVLDYNGTPATATLTVTIGNPPAATDDSAHTPFRTPVTLTPLANDTAGDDGAGVKVALDPADLVFTSSAATNSGRDLTTAEGTWAISATTGMVTFTPVSTFSGPTASVAYEITDSYGHTATAHLTVTVGAPPAASDDSATTTQNVTVTIATPLANDAAGNNGAGVAGTLVPASVVFTSASASPDGKSLTTSEGVWTIDATTGVPTFDPNPDYVGTTKPVAYQVTDSFGNVASAHWTVKVDGITPTALDDTNHGPYGSAVTTPVLGNDTAGAVSAPLVPTSVVITTVGASPDGKTLDVPGKGTWTVDAATGAITFTPVAGFHGTPAPITYQVADANGTITQAKLTVTIGNPPAATDDAASTSQNTPVSLDLLANDVAGDNGGGTTGTLDPASVAITTAGVSADGRTLVLVGKGVFTVDPATGKATFTPEPSFTGDVPVVTYTVTDSFGHTTTAEIHVTVVPVVPLAANDASTSGYGSPVTIDILGNDQPGDTHTSLVPSTLVFTDAAATEGGKVLFVAGQGTWRVNSDGTVTFTPAEGFSGRTSPVGYRVSDTNGVVTTASITVVVAAGPAASDDQVKGSRRTISVPVLANDHAGDGCTMDPSTVVLLDSDGNWIDATGSLVVDGEGAWTVNADGTLTFAATASFHGWTSWATYRVTDSCSHTAQALARVWVPQDSGDSLAYTGVAVGGVVGAAILLLVGGGLLLALRGRRRGRRFA